MSQVKFLLLLFVFASLPLYTALGRVVQTTPSGLTEITFYDSADKGKNPYRYDPHDWPQQAKKAIIEAMEIVENTLEINYMMRIAVMWSPDLDKDRYIALAYNSYVNIKGEYGVGHLDANYQYPAELIHQITGSPMYAENNITIIFNSLKDWCYSSADQPTRNQQDLITVALHEISHGFGISSAFTKSSEKTPYIFDKYLTNDRGQQLGPLFASIKPKAETELSEANLYYGGKLASKANDGQSIKLHTSSSGFSANIVHFDMKYKKDERGRLMIAGTNYGESTRFFGDFALGIFQDIGWALRASTRTGEPGYSGTVDNQSVMTADIRISGTNGQIVVDLSNCADKQQVSITTTSGKIITNQPMAGYQTFNVSSNNIYIVRVGTKVEKVYVN